MLEPKVIKSLRRTIEVTKDLLHLEKHYNGKDKTLFQLILVGLAESAHGTLEADNNHMNEETIYYHWETHIRYINQLTDFVTINKIEFDNAMNNSGLTVDNLLINKRR